MDKSDMDKINPDDNKHRASSAISSSIESETFETWTLVTPELPTDRGKEAIQEAKGPEEAYPINLQASNDDRKIDITKKDESHTDGEISDGISIISDSESGGRLSPQPAPRRLSPTKRHSPPKSLTAHQTDEENDSDNADDDISKSVIRTVNVPLTPPNTPDTKLLDAMLSPESIKDDPMSIRSINERDNESTDSESDRPLSMEINYTYAFFVALVIAILAIFGRMKTNPMLDSKDLGAVYSKLNDILARTSHIEAIIQDTMNGLDDRSFDQYSNMLTRMKELNDRFEKNNLAVKDALQSLTKFDKYPTLNTDEPNEVKIAKQYTDDNNNNKKFRKDPRMPRPNDVENNKGTKPKNNGYKKNDMRSQQQQHNYDKQQEQHKDNRKEYHDNEKPDGTQRKNGNHEYDNHRYKNNGNNGHYKEKNYKRDSRNEQQPQDADWMDRRKQSREDARKTGNNGGNGAGDKRQLEDDGNWYLERGTGRQRARKFEKVDDRE